jgi:hypothetical protein
MERLLIEGQETETCEEYIEACICRAEPPTHVLRILCLLSLTQGGIRAKKFEHLRREFLHTYGLHWLFTLDNLDKLGMLSAAPSAAAALRGGGGPGAASSGPGGRGWATLRKALRLTTPPSDKAPALDVSNPTDTNYVFNGYAPLSVRLVEIGQKNLGWKRHEELLALIPGKTFEFRQEHGSVAQNPVNLLETPSHPQGGQGQRTGAGGINLPWMGDSNKDDGRGDVASSPNNASSSGVGRKKPLTLVVFLGGVTLSEISALRFLSERDEGAGQSQGSGRDYLVATTKLTNGASFVDALVEQVQNKLNGGTGMAGANMPYPPPYPMVSKNAAAAGAAAASTPTAASAPAATPRR